MDRPGVTMVDIAMSIGQIERHVEALEKEGRFARSLTVSAIRKAEVELKALRKRIVEEGDQLREERRSMNGVQQRTSQEAQNIAP